MYPNCLTINKLVLAKVILSQRGFKKLIFQQKMTLLVHSMTAHSKKVQNCDKMIKKHACIWIKCSELDLTLFFPMFPFDPPENQ